MSTPDMPVQLPNGGWDERILAFACGRTVQVFVVLTERFTVIVDTLFSKAGAMELSRLAVAAGKARARRFNRPDPILVVINTHADWDHAWGNCVFKGPFAFSPAPIFATTGCAERLNNEQSHRELAQKLLEDPECFAGITLCEPDTMIKDEVKLAGGDLSLELMPAPGHQEDHLVVWISEIKTLLAGDALEEPFPFIQGPGHSMDMFLTFRLIKSLSPECILACHTRHQGLPNLLDHNLAYFKSVSGAVIEFIAQSLTRLNLLDTMPEKGMVVAISRRWGETLESYLNLPFSRALAKYAPDYVPQDSEDYHFYRKAHQDLLKAIWQDQVIVSN